MAQPYFTDLQTLIQPLIDELGADMDVECTHFFSGAAVYADGRICMSLTPVGFAMKLPDGPRSQVTDAGGHPLRLFPSGPIKKGYVVVPESLIDDRERLLELMRVCVKSVGE